MLAAAMMLSSAATGMAAPGTSALSYSEQAARRRDDETRQVISRFGKCVVRRKPAEAAAFVLGTVVPNDLSKAAFDDMRNSYCLAFAGWDQVLGAYFPAGSVRYTLAEALVAAEFGSPVPSFSNVPPLPPRRVDPADFQPQQGQRPSKRRSQRLEQSRTQATVAAFMDSYGECVVRSDPVGSHRLLMTEVTTPEESSEFGKLKPALAACIPNQQKMAFNKAAIRGAIALNYYRLAKALSGAAGSGEGR